MSQPSTSLSVSQTPATTTSSDIERIFDAALKSYKKKTKKDLKSHDLFKQLETCDSPAAILAVFQTAQFDTGSDDRLKTWLVPTLNVLCAFSDALGEGVSLVVIDNFRSSLSEGTHVNSIGISTSQSGLCWRWRPPFGEWPCLLPREAS
jgi:hypothetical protein